MYTHVLIWLRPCVRGCILCGQKNEERKRDEGERENPRQRIVAFMAINFWDWDRKQNTCLPSPCTELDASGVAPVVHALSCIAVTKWPS
jgi:hypothetical protein